MLDFRPRPLRCGSIAWFYFILSITKKRHWRVSFVVSSFGPILKANLSYHEKASLARKFCGQFFRPYSKSKLKLNSSVTKKIFVCVFIFLHLKPTLGTVLKFKFFQALLRIKSGINLQLYWKIGFQLKFAFRIWPFDFFPVGWCSKPPIRDTCQD